VFFNVADPLASGFVKSLSRPGGNLTGVSVHNLSLFPKRLELIRELSPTARRVVMIVDSKFQRDGYPPDFYREMQEAGRSLGLELVEEDIVLSPSGFEEAFAKASRLRPDFIVPLGPFPSLRVGNYRDLALWQNKYRVPVLGTIPAIGGPFEGLVVQLGNPVEEMRNITVGLLARVLAGSDPAETAVVQTTKVDLVVNLRAARELGIKIPKSVLTRADRVIE
jgi:putative ABC transport system substrate-binding protein